MFSFVDVIMKILIMSFWIVCEIDIRTLNNENFRNIFAKVPARKIHIGAIYICNNINLMKSVPDVTIIQY